MSTAIVPNVGTESNTGDVLSGAVAPTGLANEFFKRMQSAPEEAPAADAAQPGEQKTEIVAQPDGSLEQALDDAGKAPDKAAVAKEKKTSESIRALVKASNIPNELKEEVTALAYQGKAAQEAGLGADSIKLFKELGVSLPSVVERIQLHPTIDDARRDSILGGEMRGLINDFIHNPAVMVQKLRTTAQSSGRPDSWSAFVAAASENIEREARPVWVAKLDGEVRHILNKLAEEAASHKNEEMQVSVANVQSALGYDPGAPLASAKAGDPELLALKNENDELKKRQRQFDEGARKLFIDDATAASQTAILKEVADRFVGMRPTGMDDEESKRCVEETFAKVAQELLANQNFVNDFESFRHGDISARGKEYAVRFAVERAKSFIPYHLNAAIAFYGKRALATASVNEGKQTKAASGNDAAKVGGSTPAAPKAPDAVSTLRVNRQKGMSFRDALFTTLGGG